VSARRRAAARAATRRAALAAAPAGFTIVELLAALTVLSIALLAIAGLGVTAMGMTRRGTSQVVAAAVAQSRFDSLSSVPCRGLAVSGPTVGTSTTRGVVETWVVTDGSNVKNFADTLRVPGRTGALVYRTVLPCRD
jgi:prepilin-type N-terminal cleavage/methylation domain-containing protein